MNVIKGLLGTLLFLAIAGAIFYFVGPNLLSDWQMKDNYQVAETGQIKEGQCKSKYAVITYCDATIENVVDGQTNSNDLFYLFADFSGGDYTVNVLQSKSDPKMMSTDMGQDKLMNRVISFFVMIGLMLMLAFGSIKVMLGKEDA